MMLREMCKHIEIPSNLRDTESSLIKKWSKIAHARNNKITQCKFQTIILVN